MFLKWMLMPMRCQSQRQIWAIIKDPIVGLKICSKDINESCPIDSFLRSAGTKSTRIREWRLRIGYKWTLKLAERNSGIRLINSNLSLFILVYNAIMMNDSTYIWAMTTAVTPSPPPKPWIISQYRDCKIWIQDISDRTNRNTTI